MIRKRNSQLIRQWQILKWLSKSRRPLTLKEIYDALGLTCNFRTLRRDIVILSEVFVIERRKRRSNEDHLVMENPFILPDEFKVHGIHPNVQIFGSMKRCVVCHVLKNRTDDFHRDWKEPDEKMKRCKDCQNKKAKRRKKYFNKYYKNNRERILTQRHKRWEEDKKFKVVSQ